jgi:hypothetical protein
LAKSRLLADGIDVVVSENVRICLPTEAWFEARGCFLGRVYCVYSRRSFNDVFVLPYSDGSVS